MSVDQAPTQPAAAAPSSAPVLSTPSAVPMDGANRGSAPRDTNGGPTASPNGGPGGYTNGHAALDRNTPADGTANGTGHQNGNAQAGQNGGPAGCTAPQLRRFIKSRPYVPMHELRRRFAIDGDDDDVTPVDLEGSKVYVGLPSREGSLLGELLRGGEIGYELSFDPLAPIVVGVYPMRPVPRT